MIPRPGDTDTRSMAERLVDRCQTPLTQALAAAEHLLGDSHRLTRALESVRRELAKEINDRKTPLKTARRTRE